MLRKPIKKGEPLYARVRASEDIAADGNRPHEWAVEPLRPDHDGGMFCRARELFDVNYVVISQYAPGDEVYDTRGTCERLTVEGMVLTYQLSNGAERTAHELQPVRPPTAHEAFHRLRTSSIHDMTSYFVGADPNEDLKVVLDLAEKALKQGEG